MAILAKFCPLCGSLATSVHLIKPRSTGGTVDPRNTCLLCGSCHEAAEKIQEETGRELSPELIEEVRRKLHIKLKVNEEGISESYKVSTEEDGNIVEILLWIKMPSGTKRYINQKVSGSLGIEKPRESLSIPVPALRRKRGRPSLGVNPALLGILVHEKGMSYRQASLALERSGVRISYATIAHKLKALEEVT